MVGAAPGDPTDPVFEAAQMVWRFENLHCRQRVRQCKTENQTGGWWPCERVLVLLAEAPEIMLASLVQVPELDLMTETV